MGKKYKFILTLPDDYEVDSALEIEGHMSCGNYSQAEPFRHKGVFDTYEEAEACASKFEIYKYTGQYGYDSYYDEEEPRYYVSIYDAEDAAAAAFDVEPGEMIYPTADDYSVEEIEVEGETVYKYILYYDGNAVYDSAEENELYFETYEEAEEEARCEQDSFEVEEAGECPYALETVEILGIRIEEVSDFIIYYDCLVKYIGHDTEVLIPEGVKEIDANVFERRYAITKVVLPNSLEKIYRGAFLKCSNLTEITFPKKMPHLAREVFFGCTGLTSVTLPAGLTRIYQDCFTDCENLEQVLLPKGITNIDERAFSGCKRLTSINLPKGMTAIGPNAFRDCASLTALELPDTLTSIGYYAFAGCTNLKSITIPSSVTSFGGDFVFSGCDDLVILTPKFSAAESYARKHGIAFQRI